MDYAICTFCYGERYYAQTNRLIESFDRVEEKPEIYIVSDRPDKLINRNFVKIKNIKEYDEKYLTYASNYYDFDFSVKRFSLLFAFENGYDNVILTDTDVTPNYSLFNTENILKTFVSNTIGGQVTYNFVNEQQTNNTLGDRFKFYEKTFNVFYDRSLLNEMVEDCVQFISINKDLKFKFIDTWSDCIRIKNEKGLLNSPAGNIDEICFSALYNGLDIVNTSSLSINLLVPHHEKWY